MVAGPFGFTVVGDPARRTRRAPEPEVSSIALRTTVAERICGAAAQPSTGGGEATPARISTFDARAAIRLAAPGAVP
jgi:hypothetical protein